MKNHRLSFFIATCIALFSIKVQAQTAPLEWHTDINEVYTISHKTNKPVFAFFTGSDWCIWCKRLEAAVFSKPEFREWANKNVILLELDFPRRKQLSPQLAQQNDGLQKFFNVQGFPTVWIFNMAKDDKNNRFNISALGSLGYPQAEQGKEAIAFVEKANGILKNKK